METSRPAQETKSLPAVSADLSSAVQGHFFAFFSGMPVATFRNKSADPLDRVQGAWSAAGQGLFTLRDRGALRADLGQSQSGNSSLSPQACRLERRPPNWPYRRLDRSPLSMPLDTSVSAPLWASMKSSRGIENRGFEVQAHFAAAAISSSAVIGSTGSPKVPGTHFVLTNRNYCDLISCLAQSGWRAPDSAEERG